MTKRLTTQKTAVKGAPKHHRPLFPALILWLLLNISGCGAEETPVSESGTRTLSDAPPAVGEQTVVHEAAMGEVAIDDSKMTPIDRKDIISYTAKNQRAQPEVGAAGGTPGLLPLETDALNDEERAALKQARQVLAAHLELPDQDIAAAELVEISTQEWRNSSLGCARPGEMSAQVITPGYKVVLVLTGLRHQIHIGRRGGRVCERLQGMLQSPRRMLPIGALPQLQRDAISDLARKMNVPESSITAGRVKAGRWPDASLGCAEEGIDYAQVITAGYFLPLFVNGKSINYRTDGNRVVMCESLTDVHAQDQ